MAVSHTSITVFQQPRLLQANRSQASYTQNPELAFPPKHLHYLLVLHLSQLSALLWLLYRLARSLRSVATWETSLSRGCLAQDSLSIRITMSTWAVPAMYLSKPAFPLLPSPFSTLYTIQS